MRRRIIVPAVLAAGGIAWAGMHLLAHRLAAAGSGHAGHSHEGPGVSYLPSSLSLCLSLALVLAAAASLYPTWRGSSARSLWLFGAVPVLGLLGNAVLDSGGTLAGLGANAVELLPVAALVLAVQIAVALTAVRVARGLLDLVEAALAIAGPRLAASAAPLRSFPLIESDRTPAGLLVPSGGSRAPPASPSAF